MDWALLLQIGGVASIVFSALWFVYNKGEKRGKEKAKEDSLVTTVAAMAADVRQLRIELTSHVQADNERFEAAQREQTSTARQVRQHDADLNKLKQRR